jgi:hypothetical protein
MQLTHSFAKAYKNKINFKGIITLNDFSKFISKESYNLFPVSMYKFGKEERDSNQDNRNKFVGDAFECFIECLIKCNPTDWVRDYYPNTEFDKGVDGWGIGHNDKIATIQIKFRSNIDLPLEQSSVYSFILYSWGNCDDPSKRVDINDTQNLFIFTNCKDIDYRLENHIGKKVHAVVNKNIRQRVDNNNLFWREFNENFI